MPSTLPLSPLLGPMVSNLEHLCLQISQTKPRCLCLKRFQRFNCLFLIINIKSVNYLIV